MHKTTEKKDAISQSADASWLAESATHNDEKRSVAGSRNPPVAVFQGDGSPGSDMKGYIQKKQPSQTPLCCGTEAVRHEYFPNVLCALDQDGTVRFVGPSIEQVAGYRPSALRGKNWWQLLFPGPASRQVVELRQCLDANDSCGLAMTLQAKDGSSRELWWHFVKRRNAEGGLVEILGVGSVRLESGPLWRSPCGKDIPHGGGGVALKDRLHGEQHLLQQSFDLHERERRLMAYEIHDGLAQQITAALLQFQAAEVLGDDWSEEGRQSEELREAFACGMKMLHQGIDETRRLISGLRFAITAKAGIIEALDGLVRDSESLGLPKIEFVHDLRTDRLTSSLEAAIYRIVQECLSNARRHSKSERLRLRLGQQKDRVRVEIEDWGQGFESKNVALACCGLEGIRERAHMLGGDAVIESRPGEGTRIIVDLPLAISAGDH